ncbi:MAG TPA: hypothetical protein QGH10_12615 [Armatimonadota bacterium]|nr:hypothetical protein [Armatimonadota bacterium]
MRKSIAVVVATLIASVVIGVVWCPAQLVPEEQRTPEFFEPYLLEHPGSEALRRQALVHYSLKERDEEKLKHHTLLMIEHSPGNNDIHYMNGRLFSEDPEYTDEVIRRLEAANEASPGDAEILAVLAGVCEAGAREARWAPGRDADRLEELTDKALSYYEGAVDAAGDDDFHMAFYSKQWADLLATNDRTEEAVDVCEAAIPMAGGIAEISLFLTYAECLYDLDRLDEAMDVAQAAIDADGARERRDPDCHTTRGHHIRGRILLDRDDVDGAVAALMAGTEVEACPHNKSFGPNLDLAKRLLKRGRHADVEAFCDAVIDRHNPMSDGVRELREKARAQQD